MTLDTKIVTSAIFSSTLRYVLCMFKWDDTDGATDVFYLTHHSLHNNITLKIAATVPKSRKCNYPADNFLAALFL